MSKKLPILFLFLSFNFWAQTEESFNLGFESNAQYYVDDQVTGDFTASDRFRSNSYLKAEYLVQNFTFGIQVEGYAPQALLNYSPQYNDPINIGLYYAQFKNDKLDITLGHFYEQFGNGLALRSWEDRQLGINNAIRGIKLKYKPTENISLTGLFGNQRVGFKVSEGELFGLDTQFDMPQMFKSENTSGSIGFSYVGRYQENESDNPDFKKLTSAFSGRLQMNVHNFSTGLEGVVKMDDAYVENGTLYSDKLFKGNALQFNLGYSQKGLGINATLRRLENMNFYSEIEALGNTYNELIVNYIPALTKQHDYSLANMYVYQSQPGLSFNPLEKAGEIGGQIDVFFNLKKDTPLGGKYGTKVSVNFASWYALKADFISEYQRVDVGFLEAGEHYFSDMSLEVRKKLSPKVSGILTFLHGNYNKKYVEETYGFVKSNVAIAETTIQTSEKTSLRIEAQHLWTRDDKKNWAAATMEFNANTHMSFFATDLYNYGNEDLNHRDHYYLLGGSYSKDRTRIALSYGRQRGGILCVGGVCREVPPASGLTLNITTSL
jgi:hypothetical protein